MLDEAQLQELIRKNGLAQGGAQIESGAAAPPLPVEPETALTGRELKVDIPGKNPTQPGAPAPAASAGFIPPPFERAAPRVKAGIDTNPLSESYGFPAAAQKINTPVPPAQTDEPDIAAARSAIKGIESGDRYDIVHPKAKNGDNALGAYGVMSANLPSWSRETLGREVSRDEFLKSPELQDRIFDHKFGSYVRKYGLEGAARAWFAGEGGMNNPSASDGNVTVDQYASKFMGALGGVATSGRTGARTGNLSQEEITKLIGERGLAEGAGKPREIGLLGEFGDDLLERAKAVGTGYIQYEAGLLKGLASVPLGLAQTASEMTGNWFKPMEGRIAELEDALDQQTGGKGTWADLAGRVVGSTLGIIGGARTLGPIVGPAAARVMPQIATRVWGALGPITRTTLQSVPLAATTYYPKGAAEETRLGLERIVPARAIDGVMFGMLGTIVGTVARGVQWAATNLSKTSAGLREEQRLAASEASDALLAEFQRQAPARFEAVLQNTANGMTKNTEGPLRNAVSHYQNVEKVAQSTFGLRNAAGQQFEGFASGVGAAETGAATGFKQALDDAVTLSPRAGVEQKAAAQAAERRVRDELGLAREEGRFAAWQTEQRLYGQSLATYEQALAQHPLRGAFERNPQLMAQLEAAGQLPAKPTPPKPFVPEPVKAADYLQARTSLNAAWRRTKDAALKTQLGQMLSAIDGVAAQEAATYGMSVKDFTRLAAQSNKFYEQHVAPLRYGLFKGRTSAEVAGRPGTPFSGVTPAEFYETVMTPVRRNDLTAVRDLKKALGPASERDLAGMVASEMILMSDTAARRYVASHSDVLRELLGRGEFEQLRGLAHIADHVKGYKPFVAPKKPGDKDADNQRFMDGLMSGGANRVGFWFGFYQLGRAVWDVGDRAQHLKEAALYFGGPPLVNLTFGLIKRIHDVPFVRPLVRKAGTMEPGSKELDDYLLAIERQIQKNTLPAQRGVSESLDSR